VAAAMSALGAVLAIAITVAPVGAQKKNPYRDYTAEKFVQNMQSAGRNYAAVADLLAKTDYESAKAQLTRVREQLAITVTFWRDQKIEDAIKLLNDTVAHLDELDAALSDESLNAAAITGASQRVAAACQACHAIYRSQDPATKAFRLKLGSAQ
jgi:hypothetical protein